MDPRLCGPKLTNYRNHSQALKLSSTLIKLADLKKTSEMTPIKDELLAGYKVLVISQENLIKAAIKLGILIPFY